MEDLTHWKKFHNYEYLGSYSIKEGETLTATIKSLGTEKVTGQNGKKEDCFVIHFSENLKPFICNRTNAKAITKALRTPYIEQWKGKKIELFVSRVNAFGESVDAIRVKDIATVTTQIDPTEAIFKLQGCATLIELQQVYKSLSKLEQNDPNVISVKDDLKTKLK